MQDQGVARARLQGDLADTVQLEDRGRDTRLQASRANRNTVSAAVCVP